MILGASAPHQCTGAAFTRIRGADARAAGCTHDTRPVAIESLGGYRLVRKLGEGQRAEVFLAHPERDDADAVPVAIKLARADVGDASIIEEVTALSRAAGEHVVGLLDVAPGPDGAPALVLQRLAGGSLGRLLRDRANLRPGEAITILAPLAMTVAHLHDAGVVHGGVRSEAVLFDGAGAPALACFGRASLIEPHLPPARRTAEPGIAADVRAVAAVSRAVLGVVHDDAAALLAEWVESSSAIAADDWLGQFAGRLFELGDAEAVDFRADAGEQDAPRVPGRVLTGAPLVEAELPRSGALVAIGLPEWIEGVLPGEIVERVRRSLSAVRARVWIAAGAVAAALVAALVLVPPGDSDASPSPSASPTASAAPAVDAGPVGGDDPVAALLALLAARDRCIRDLSVLCLDDVDQPGSSALADDQSLIRALQGGGEMPPAVEVPGKQATLEERLGDSAIVFLGGDSEPASFLLMKGEAGWRIRDYLD